MSAILGRIELDGRPVADPKFESVLDRLAHFGGDGRLTHVADSVGIGAQIRKIARAPEAETRIETLGPLSIVADAILDRRTDLAQTLGIDQHEAATLPDSALLLRAYAKWGRDCNRHLRGDYAFAVVDADRREVFLTRDHIGSRPLFWSRCGGTLLFSTSVDGIIGFSDFEWKLDELSIAEFLSYYSYFNPFTFYRHVRAVEPGHWVKVTASRAESRRWWHPGDAAQVRYTNRQEYNDHFEELTAQAIGRRCDTDLNVGSHISGGIDSSTVAALADRSLQNRNRRLTGLYAWAPDFSDLYPDSGKRDERHMIGRMGAQVDAPVRFGTSDSDRWLEFMERPLDKEGVADLYDELQVLEAAEADRVGVMLSGWGGDEAYSAHGIGYVAALLKRGRLVDAVRAVRALHHGRRNPKILGPTLWRLGMVPLLPEPIYKHLGGYPDVKPNRSFARHDMVEALNRSGRPRYSFVRPVSDPVQYLASLLLNGHIAMRMDTWAEWGAQRGVQYRYPLTDRDLVEFMLGLPFDMFIVDGESRFLSNTLAKKILPGEGNKYDRSMEDLRSHVRRTAWQTLSAQAAEGRFDAACDWLDMPTLHRSIAAGPPDNWSDETIIQICEISEALRVWHLFQRTA